MLMLVHMTLMNKKTPMVMVFVMVRMHFLRMPKSRRTRIVMVWATMQMHFLKTRKNKRTVMAMASETMLTHFQKTPRSKQKDSDGDGVGDNADAFPEDPK